MNLIFSPNVMLNSEEEVLCSEYAQEKHLLLQCPSKERRCGGIHYCKQTFSKVLQRRIAEKEDHRKRRIAEKGGLQKKEDYRKGGSQIMRIV